MSTKVQLRREAAAFLASYVGAPGELLVDTTNNRVLVQDGATPGGFPQAKLSDLGGRNLLINGNFAVNQRGYASGTTLAANAFGHDRWRDGGFGGLTYTFNQGTPDTTITITAGQSTQTIEPSNVAGGTYVLSWVGTIVVSVGYTNSSGQATNVIGASPLVAPNVGPGSLIYVETSGTGTLGLIQFEAGTVPTAFERRQPALEMLLCQRYYQVIQPSVRFYGTNSGQTVDCFTVFTPMRTTPTTALVSAGTRNNISHAALLTTSSNSARFEVAGNAVGDTYALVDTWSLSAEL